MRVSVTVAVSDCVCDWLWVIDGVVEALAVRVDDGVRVALEVPLEDGDCDCDLVLDMDADPEILEVCEKDAVGD